MLACVVTQTDAWLHDLQISEDRTYAVRQPTAHAINENHRVRCFRQMLLGPLESPEQLLNLGDLMYLVHSSFLTMVVCNLAGLYHVHFSQDVMRDNLNSQHGHTALAHIHHKHNAL